MKNIKNQFIAIVLGLFVFTACHKEDGDLVETKTVDLESLTLGTTAYWNGSDKTGEFNALGVKFQNNYNSTYSSWDGFAYSQKADITTSGDGNQYSVFDGANGTNKFGIYYLPYGSDAFASFPTGSEYLVKSVNVCNTTYTALILKNGDSSFAKKFGGATGNDKDWYKMTVVGFNLAGESKSIDFYLADYRFEDNTKDFIVNKWTSIDLSSLGKINKLTFRFTSTDNDPIYGMNTPAYACFDDLKYEIVTTEL